MHVSFLTCFSNGLPRSIVAFCHCFNNGLPRSFGHWRRRLTNTQAFSLGVIELFSVCVKEHLTDCGIIVIDVLEEPLLGEPFRSWTPDWTRRTSLWVGEVERWIIRNERRKLKMMKRSRKSERTLTSCMAMTMGWNETNTRTSWAMRCVQEMSECDKTEQGLRRLQHYAHAHVFVLCFVLFLWILVFTLSWVSDASTSSKMVSFVNCISPRTRNIKCKVLSFWML